VQALVAFPAVLALLNRDIRWTTDLGNAFLAQQADVMNAVQRMRARARDNGRLASTPQQTVTGESTIEIQPANPQIIYVPSYNPSYVWGAGAYPALGYGSGFSFNPGILLSAIFTGLMSFTGWGWALNWLAHGLFLNNLFFSHFGFGGGGGAGLGARSAWVHNPGHRLGVAYPNRMVASRFAAAHTYAARSYAASPARSTAGRSYQSYSRGSTAQSYRSPSSYARPQAQGSARSYRPAASAHYSAPKMSRSSAPRAPKAPHMKAPKAPHGSSHSRGHSGGKHK
jgi:hypothetical protein